MITLEELATKVDALERKVAKLTDETEGQDRFNTRLMGMVKEVRDDVAAVRADVALMRSHEVAIGQKLEEMDSRLTSRVEKLDANIAGLRRDLPDMIAETMREVFRERDGRG